MSEALADSTTLQNRWGADLEMAVCKHCHWRYLIPVHELRPTCPHCYQQPLAVLSGPSLETGNPYSPELMIPFGLTEPQLAESIHDFAEGIPFAPKGLTEPHLRTHLMPVYLPAWLVDGFVTGYWQADAGFDYAVVSHQESYNGDMHQWQSREIKEPRIRWENRVGRLSRTYQNVAAPALDDANRLEKLLGRYNFASARSYNPECLKQNGRWSFIRLPDHLPKEAWSEAAASFQKTVAAECQQACDANHLRQFRWNVNFSQLNWTLMLLPLYSASYLDDDGKPQPILIHGQTGKITGVRKASFRLARKASLHILLTGIVLFLLAVLLDHFAAATPVVNALSTYISILGIAGILASAAPLLIAWDFNHKQALDQAETRL